MEVPEKIYFNAGETIDGYRIVGSLGEGGYGVVYKVAHSSGEEMALKVLKLYEISTADRAEYAKRFERDFNTAQKIKSDYLVKSHRQGSVRGNPYYLMELCEGGTLQDEMERQTNWPSARVHGIIREVLQGLKAMHSQGVFHRDIKPSNIFLKNNTFKIGDFGTACFVNNRLTKRTFFFGKSQNVFGTLPFIPPEALRLDFNVTPRFDIFSFGVTLYFVLSGGKLPYGFIGNTYTEKELNDYIARIEAGKKEDLRTYNPSVSGSMLSFINQCIEGNADRRFATVDEALSAAAKFTPGSSKPINVESKTNYAIADTETIGFRVQTGEEVGRIYNFELALQLAKDGKTIRIGRSSPAAKNANEISIKDTQNTYISRKQATLIKSGKCNKWILKNGQEEKGRWLQPPNPTLVNQKEIPPEGIELQIGDVVSFADTMMRLIVKRPYSLT